MRPLSAGLALLSCTLILSACGSGETAGEQAVAADTLALAEAAFDPAAFDTIAWVADSARVNRGAIVWTYSCQKCHGSSGRGDGGFVMNGDTLRPPSFREPEWRFGGDADGLRRQIFVGTNTGMPHWGLVGLKPRDIEAVASYILDIMRYDVRTAAQAAAAGVQ